MCEKSRVFLFHIFVSFYRLTGPFLFYFADFVRQRLFLIFPLKVFAGIGARPVRIDPLAHGGPLTAVLTSSVVFSRVWGQIWVFTMSSHLLLKYWLLYWSAIVIILVLAIKSIEKCSYIFKLFILLCIKVIDSLVLYRIYHVFCLF